MKRPLEAHRVHSSPEWWLWTCTVLLALTEVFNMDLGEAPRFPREPFQHYLQRIYIVHWIAWRRWQIRAVAVGIAMLAVGFATHRL